MKEAHDRKVALFMGQEAEREQEEAGIKYNLQSHGVNDLLPPTVHSLLPPLPAMPSYKSTKGCIVYQFRAVTI